MEAHRGFDAWIGPPITDMKKIVQIGMYTVRAPDRRPAVLFSMMDPN